MDTVKVGVVGVGVLGRHHVRLYRECAGVDLVGLYDSNPKTASRVASEFGVEVFESIDGLAAEVDGLSIAVPTHLHYEISRPLLEQGKHLLIEKPITRRADRARELVSTGRENGLVLQVGHVERFNPVLDCLDEIPGRPLFVEAHRLASYPPPRREGMHPRGTEVSVVLDLMIHDIDVVLAIVDSRIERLDAVGVCVLSDSEDIANAHIVFENGCIANLTASRVSSEQMRRMRVFKPSAYLSLDYGTHKGALVRRKGDRIVRRSMSVDTGVNALKVELEDFCRCVRDAVHGEAARPPKVTGGQGLRALRVGERILDEIGSG